MGTRAPYPTPPHGSLRNPARCRNRVRWWKHRWARAMPVTTPMQGGPARAGLYQTLQYHAVAAVTHEVTAIDLANLDNKNRGQDRTDPNHNHAGKGNPCPCT